MSRIQVKRFVFIGDPMARTMNELVTPRQLAAIRVIGNSLGIDYEDQCKALTGCKPEELCRDAASAVIAWFKSDNFKAAAQEAVA